MTINSLVIWTVIVLFVAILILFPEFRKKLKVLCGGFLGVFIEDAAKTPEGANAIYQQAIEEKQKDYNEASDMLRQLSGQLNKAQTELQSSQVYLEKVSKECEGLVSKNDLENASIKAEEREGIVAEIKRHNLAIAKLNPLVSSAKELYAKAGKDLETLKRDKTNVVEELKLNKQLTKAYDGMDKLKRSSTTSKLLENVREGIDNSQVNATGAKVVYENSMDAKIAKAEQAAAKISTSDYLDELKKKYNK